MQQVVSQSPDSYFVPLWYIINYVMKWHTLGLVHCLNFICIGLLVYWVFDLAFSSSISLWVMLLIIQARFRRVVFLYFQESEWSIQFPLNKTKSTEMCQTWKRSYKLHSHLFYLICNKASICSFNLKVVWISISHLRMLITSKSFYILINFKTLLQPYKLQNPFTTL